MKTKKDIFVHENLGRALFRNKDNDFECKNLTKCFGSTIKP